MKIKDMVYVRVDIDKAIEYVTDASERMKKAVCGRDMAAIRDEYIENEKHIQTMVSLSNIRFTLDTTDNFYQAEKKYYDKNLPRLSAVAVKFNRAFLCNRHVVEALEFINPNVAEAYEISLKVMDDLIVADLAEESRLVTKYSKLMSETVYNYKGERMPFSVFRKYFDDANRMVRRKTMEIAGQTLQKNAFHLDTIFDQLVRVRSKMARKLGFESYSAMGDYRMGRYSYNRHNIRAFRNEVKNEVVPIVDRIRREKAAQLGISEIMLYDDDTYFKNGNPEPILGLKRMFTAAKRMYIDLGNDTTEFINMMLEADAFDVFPRRGKWTGGYCTSIDDYGQPFVLANFNGSSGDVDVLTHEAGHALAFYEQVKNNIDYELGTGTMSIAEIHSMTMEFFAWKYMKKFFGYRAHDYRYYHLLSSLSFLPYGCQVDEFEETCYEHPDMSSKDRNKVWQDLDIYYRPYINSKGIPYFENGTRWQYQMHIYENPLYYIDYCLSQNVAHQFLLLMQDDYDATFEKYLQLVKKGGTLPFGELVESVGLKSPLTGGVTAETAKQIERLAIMLNDVCEYENNKDVVTKLK